MYIDLQLSIQRVGCIDYAFISIIYAFIIKYWSCMDIKFLENSIGRMVVYLKSSVYKNVLYICYILLDQYWIWRVRPWARLLNRFNVMYMSLRTLLYLDMFPKPGENLYSSYKKRLSIVSRLSKFILRQKIERML